MLIEQLIFIILAFVLFVYIFYQLIKKKETKNMTKLENKLLNLRKMLNKLEDKGYYTPELVTKKDIVKYRRLNNLWLKLLNKVNA